MAVLTAPGYPDLKSKGIIMSVFAKAVRSQLYAKTCLPNISESGYLGQIKEVGQTVTIATTPRVKTGKYSRGMVVPISTEVADPLTLKVERSRYWNQFWDRLDEHQTHLRMLKPETAKGAAAQVACDMEEEFFGEMGTLPHAKNVGNAAGAQSEGYKLGTLDSPIGVTSKTLVPYLTQHSSVIGEQNVSEVTDGRKAIIIPQMFHWYLVNSPQLANAAFIGGDSALKTNRVVDLGGMDVYVSTLLKATIVSGKRVFPILCVSKKALNFVVALDEVTTVEPSQMHGTLTKGLVLYDWGNVRSEGISLGYAYGNDTELIPTP